MPGTTLTTLPREIRDHIFEYVLSSPTGQIHLQDRFIRLPWYNTSVSNNDPHHDGRGTISLSFLRTCQLIYDECKDRLWDYNTLDLGTDSRAYSGLYFNKG